MNAETAEMTEAVNHFNAHDYEGAANVLREAAKKNADLPPPQVVMAQFFAQAKMPGPARNALERAVLEDPTDPEAYMLIGQIAVGERRFTEAEMVYQKAGNLILEFKKSARRKNIIQADIYSGLASVNEARKNWAEVKKQLEAWLKIDSTSTVAMQRLAQCLVQQKDVAGGLEELKQAAKLDPKMLTPEAILGQWCEQSGDHENAKKYIALALKAAPKDPRTLLMAGQWALETGQLDEAQTQAAAAMKLDDKSLDAKLLRGTIALFQKDYATAERALEDAHLQSPDDFRASNNLALALLGQNNPTKNRQALAYAEANARKFQQSPQAAATYGWALYKMDQPDEADRLLRTAISGGAVTADMAYYLACVDVERKKRARSQGALGGGVEEHGAVCHAARGRVPVGTIEEFGTGEKIRESLLATPVLAVPFPNGEGRTF